MARPRTDKQRQAVVPDPTLRITAAPGENAQQALARGLVAPDYRHAMATAQLLDGHVLGAGGAGLGDLAEALRGQGDKAAGGDLEFASRMLAAQASTLDAIFAEMTRRMATQHISASDTYARIALKAQAGSRAALETLVRLHQPRETPAHHVHVNEGAQALIADQVHHHAA